MPEDLPDFADRSVNAVVGVEENPLAPNLLDNLIPGDELSPVLQEKQQEFHGGGFEFENSCSPAQLGQRGLETASKTEC